MAEFGDRYAEFTRAGSEVAALSVDAPAASEAVRRRYALPFPILCDTAADVCRAWGLYDPAEKGGVARPAVFLLDATLRVLQRSLDGTLGRARAADVLAALASAGPLRRRLVVPRLGELLRTAWPALRLTLRPPRHRPR